MKLMLSILFFLPALATATTTATTANCSAAAWKAANGYMEVLTKEFVKDQKKNLEPGQKIDEADLPGGLTLEGTEDNGTYTFTYGQQQECACGFSIQTKVTKGGSWCDGKVKERAGCECG